ncbi:MAG TPA: hypothetical protein VFK44_06375 [Bacillales bacterium]|nr:hypothetical protein [Bacillales bacterium]
MKASLMQDFQLFLEQYRESWNGLDAAAMSNYASKQLKVRWANPETVVADWGTENAEQGWKQAYERYRGRNPKWRFEDVLVEINEQQEGVAVFWVTFEVDGNPSDAKLLFVEAFRKEKGEWKKIREYVENKFSRTSSG